MTDPASPFLIGPLEPSATDARLLVALESMLQASRRFLLAAARDLDVAQLDARPVAGVNSIGAILAHVAAAERMFQNITARGFTFAEEDAEEAAAFRFEGNPLAGRELEAYHERLASVRRDTIGLLGTKDDAWLATERTFAGRPSNTHYYWTHLLMDEARHTGQIIVVRKYLLAEPDPGFDPYRFDP